MTQHCLLPEHQQVNGDQYWWLAGGYDLEIRHFRSGYHGGYLGDSGFFV